MLILTMLPNSFDPAKVWLMKVMCVFLYFLNTFLQAIYTHSLTSGADAFALA